MSIEAALQRNLPIFSQHDIEGLVNKLYGVKGEYKQLASERDLSWRIVASTGDAFVVKVSNVAEPEGVVDMQIKTLQHIAKRDPGLPVPRVVPTLGGSSVEWIEAVTGERHMIRLLTFLQGSAMENVPEAFCPKYRYNIGATVGRLTLALRNFFHPYAASNAHLWDISRALSLRPQIERLKDTDLANLCRSVLDRTEQFVLPQLKSRTRWQVVHQDAHGGNVLVDAKAPSTPIGIIDFGDMGYNTVLADIVVAAENFSAEDSDPIGHICDVAAGFDSSFPLEEAEIDLIYDTMLLRLAMSAIVVGIREVLDQDAMSHIEDASAYSRMLRLLHAQGRPEAIRRLRQACRFPVYSASEEGDEDSPSNYQEAREKREEYLGPIWHFYNEPLHFKRARGAWMYAADGAAYLDAYNNVPQIGHSHPHVARAIARQAAVLNTNTRYLCDIAADYAERLTADLPGHLDTVIFVNSGSEANDLAMQIAKSFSGNRGGLVMEQSYHGCTELTTALSHESWGGQPKSLHPRDVELLMVPDCYRGKYAGAPDAAESYAADADRAIADLADRGLKPAAFMIDTSLCSSGVVDAPADYFNLVAAKTRAAGGFVIADEVQAGLGRMGTFWGFRANGLADENVDIVTMGKPIGNGHPLGAIILSSNIMKEFVNGTHPLLFSTFGGNTVACAAGMAVLDVLERESLIPRGKDIGDRLRTELRRLADAFSIIGNVRGKGMLTGVEFVTDRTCKSPANTQTEAIIEEMRRRKILIGKSSSNVLKLRPPLLWGQRELEFFVVGLSHSLRAVA